MLTKKRITLLRSPNDLSYIAKDWNTRIGANSGSIPAYILKAIDDILIKPCDANGKVFPNADRISLSIGLSGYVIAAKTTLWGNYLEVASPGITQPNSVMIFDNNGSKSDGGGYLKTNYNPAVVNGKFQQNDNSFGAMIKTPSSAFMYKLAADDGSNYTALFTDSSYRKRTNNNAVNNPTSFTDTTTGWVNIVSLRNSSSQCLTIINDTTVNTANRTSTGIVNAQFFKHARNVKTAGVDTDSGTGYNTDYIGADWHGNSNFDYAFFRACFNNLANYFGV